MFCCDIVEGTALENPWLSHMICAGQKPVFGLTLQYDLLHFAITW